MLTTYSWLETQLCNVQSAALCGCMNVWRCLNSRRERGWMIGYCIDVWCWVQFEMLTGSLPFQGQNRKDTMTMILKWVRVTVTYFTARHSALFLVPLFITVSHGSAYTVVRVMQQVNGKWQFCGLRGCKNRPTPFPGRMSYKATEPGLVLFYILACFNCIVAS